MRHQGSFLYLAVMAAFAMFSLSSCGDVEQNLVINLDGSGTLETTFDIGEMMSMVKGFGDAGTEDVTISSEENPDTAMVPPEAPKDAMQLIIDKVTDPAYDQDFDTLIGFLSIMPDSVKEKETRLDLVNKISIRMKSPAKSSDLLIGLVMAFDNQAQLKELVEYMKTMDNSSSTNIMSGSGAGLQSETFLVFTADMKAGWIRVDSVDYSGMASELGMSSDSLMSAEDTGMLEMMLGGSKIKSIIHVPGEISSCTNKEAILTKDNKVMIEYSFMDVLRKGKIEGYTINFTPKK